MKNKSLTAYLLTLAVIAALAWYVSAYHYQLLLISGESMAPACRNGQLALVDKRARDYRAGDILLFSSGELGGLVKRAAAVAGDSLLAKDGVLYINGVARARLPEESLRMAELGETPFILPEDVYFMLGDNLTVSVDSRYAQIGPVNAGDILGRVVFLFGPGAGSGAGQKS